MREMVIEIIIFGCMFVGCIVAGALYARGKRAQIARKHTKEMQKKYSRCIQTAILTTKIYETNSFNSDFEKDVEDKEIKIIVEDIDSVGAVIKYGNPRTAVLNFSSYINPGGGFMNGSKSQEPCLCHASFLYNVLFMFAEVEWDYLFLY